MHRITVAWLLWRAAVRSQVQYRANFAFLAVLGIVYQTTGIAFLWVVLQRFGSVAGWTFDEVALLYALRLVAHAVWSLPFHEVQHLRLLVRDGDFGRHLLRPAGLLTQVATAKFQLNVLGDVIAAAVLLTYAIHSADLALTPLRVLFLVSAIIGGALIEGAFVLLASSLSFRHVQTAGANKMVDTVFLLFGSYPTSIFGVTINTIMTWIVPLAFVAYVPAGVLFGKGDSLGMPEVLEWGAPLVGVIWFGAAYVIWRRQALRFEGVGS